MDKGCRPTYCVCGFRFPQRYVVVLLSVFGFLVCCGQRDNGDIGIAVALKQMRDNIRNYTDEDIRKAENEADNSDVLLHMVVMGLYAGHFLGLISFGILADVLGCRWVFFYGILTATGITLLTPVIVLRAGYLPLFFLRVALGIFQSAVFPCTSSLLAFWIPVNERSVLGGIIFSSYPVSVLLAHIISNLIRPSVHQWQNCYYFWGGLGIVWCILFALLVYSNPEAHPRITEEEHEFLKDKVPRKEHSVLPIMRILRDRGIWAIIAGQMGPKMTIHLLIWDTPWQMRCALHLTLKQLQIVVALSAMGLWLSTITTGIITTYGATKKKWDLKWTRRIASTIRFPQRYVVVLFSVLGFLVCCGQRDNGDIGIAVALKQMRDNIRNYTVQDIRKAENEADNSDVLLHMVIMGLYAGHFLALIPIGIFADVLGCRWVFFYGIIAATGITLLTPVIVLRAGYLPLFFIRVALGMCQGVVFPCTSALLGFWIPVNERSVSGGIIFSSYPISVLLAHIISNFIRPTVYQWQNCYYFWGGLGIVWCTFFALLIYSTPEEHPRITEEEWEFLKNKLPRKVHSILPITRILKDGGVWAIIAGQMGPKMTIHLLIWDTPWQMKCALKLSLKKLVIVVASSAIGLWLCTISVGIITTYGVTKKKWDLRWTRRIASTTFIIPNICMCIQVYIRKEFITIASYAVALLSLAPYYSSFKVNHLDISIHYPGLVFAIIDTFGDFVSLISFIIMKNVRSLDFEYYWRVQAWLAVGVTCVSIACYFYGVQVKRAAWDILPYEAEQLEEEGNSRRAAKAK